MEKISVSLRPDQLERLETRVEETDADSRSAALRQLLDEYEDVTAECEELHTRCERLEREKRLVLEEREEKAELARYAEEQRTRQQRKDEAGLGTRAKWWLFGMSDSEA
jgi:metal-responsive CopG/Arc/MetJ family transcriptional regulator